MTVVVSIHVCEQLNQSLSIKAELEGCELLKAEWEITVGDWLAGMTVKVSENRGDLLEFIKAVVDERGYSLEKFFLL